MPMTPRETAILGLLADTTRTIYRVTNVSGGGEYGVVEEMEINGCGVLGEHDLLLSPFPAPPPPYDVIRIPGAGLTLRNDGEIRVYGPVGPELLRMRPQEPTAVADEVTSILGMKE